ncbi:hypothetical protein M3661_17030 [Paenibacillus sp. MER 180]|uniref:hypothetical protein n=1 Tax=Paenibacillus sp. MER 180 TaxID=2939570 RepID=UPI0020421C32|nr:hypothetical protein [Paenibacillus sp. MER 180]MCM3291836.1 hypothetical protein [Paenibacillus sp. MER 180]
MGKHTYDPGAVFRNYEWFARVIRKEDNKEVFLEKCLDEDTALTVAFEAVERIRKQEQ